jgi:hypothetical protein
MSRLTKVLLLLTLGSACTQDPTPRATRSLRGTSDVSFVCAALGEDGNLEGRPADACPDYFADGEGRALYALATQKETGEIAVLDMHDCQDGSSCRGRVRDLEGTQPGVNFLPVGAEPVAIASTPGGMASFVAVAEVGREGIFALPTSCIGPRPEQDTYRDLRTWPACRLPTAPGAMTIVVDADRATACDGTTVGRSHADLECPADLRWELRTPGRHKLVVTLPARGEVVILDAQAVLDLPPGDFGDCPVETVVALEVALPDAPPAQDLPADLQAEDVSCQPQPAPYAPASGPFVPRPSDLAHRSSTMYVSDFDAPVVHVLDFEDSCAVQEREPLLPVSYTAPGTVTTTRRVAVSPMTSTGNQYVYAVDNSSGPTAGSLMVFDVSPGATERTPIVRPRSSLILDEPADRIQFDQEVSDIEFAQQDQPLPDASGVAQDGILCDPDPSLEGGSTGDHSALPSVQYRPSSDGYGASPAKLRGIFGFAALHSGFVTVIDVEDLDAPCRRPRYTNTSAEADFRGCANDQFDELVTSADTPTVSDELSCNIVERHRTRAASYFRASGGGGAPFLRSFPQLRAGDGTSLAVDRTDRGQRHPRLLAINYAPAESTPQGPKGDAEVSVGATLYRNDPEEADRLVLDPAVSKRNSTVLPVLEPRAYSGTVVNSVTFEGIVRGTGDSPFTVESAADLALDGTGSDATFGVFQGGLNAGFCASGIEDIPAMRARGARLMSGADDETLDSFAGRHVDYVEITQHLLDSDDRHWAQSPGKGCGAQYQASNEKQPGRQVCERFFGSAELPDRHRELRLVRAFNDRLVVEPRAYDSRAERDAVLELVECCFPAGVEFRVRASQQWVRRADDQLSHPMQTNPETLACERGCSPLQANRDGRIFEIACDGDACANTPERAPAIGPSRFPDQGDQGDADYAEQSRAIACIIDEHPVGGVQPGGPGSQCVYESLTARFAIYRGLSPSERGMQFRWTTIGGFRPLSVDLFGVNQFQTTTMPEKLLYVPQINRLAVADGGTSGLFFVGLRATEGGPGISTSVAF